MIPIYIIMSHGCHFPMLNTASIIGKLVTDRKETYKGQTQARILNIIPASNAKGVGLILAREQRSHILHTVAKKNYSFLCSQFIYTSVNPLESIEVAYSKYRLKC